MITIKWNVILFFFKPSNTVCSHFIVDFYFILIFFNDKFWIKVWFHYNIFYDYLIMFILFLISSSCHRFLTFQTIKDALSFSHEHSCYQIYPL